MTVTRSIDDAVPQIAAAIGEPARARMLYSLMDGHARTATELSIIAEVSPSTASVHLARLAAERLVKSVKQGKHRYYTLYGPDVARVLEGLSVLAGAPRTPFVPRTPDRLCAARTCYDHIAGTLGVSLHDRVRAMRWITAEANAEPIAYQMTRRGETGLAELGIDIGELRHSRRRFAFACLDWSERRPHLGGALGAALLSLAYKKKWLTQALDSRALDISSRGRRELQKHFGLSS